MTKFVKKVFKCLFHFWMTYQNWIALMISNQTTGRLCHISNTHCVRYLFINGEIVVRKKYTEDDNEDGCFYLYEYVIETKMQKYNRYIYTLYRDMGNTYLHRHALVHFQIHINYKYDATPHENRKKSHKSYLKTMSSTIECLKISVSSKKLKSAYIGIMGKVEKTSSPIELPKNYNQTSYARNLVKKSLNLFQILEMIYCKLKT